MMRCPVCSQVLLAMKAGGVMVDVCMNGCGGIWFDQFELNRLDEPGETAGEILNKVSEAQSIGDTPEEQRLCPRCSDVVMMRHYFSPRRQVMVDECPQCGGCWLDAGELAVIRREKQEENEFRQAVEDYLARISPSELRSLLETARHRYGAPGKRE